jgi:3-methyl-2-oxobutanoate hydroxymethyltransferase
VQSSESKPLTIEALHALKSRGEPIATLTAYDATFARAIDDAGVELILVGDSLGMVIHGERHTLGVTVEDIVYHCRAVSVGARSALVVADVPFMAAATLDRAIQSAQALLGRGHAKMVKVEGAGHMLEIIAGLSERDVPVCAHLGLTPQSVFKLSGFKVQGRSPDAAEQIKRDARAVQAAGAQLLVLECVPGELAREISGELQIPTIGIGAGVHCDGQILVLHDLLNLGLGRRPRFSKDFLADGGSIDGALRAYVEAVKARRFPGPEHTF